MALEDSKLCDPTTDSTSVVRVKLPPFWSHEPEKWFLLSEAQFRLKYVTKSSTKFDYVVSSLGSDVISRIPSSVLSPGPSDTDPYQTLKTDLYKIFNIKPAQRIATFLDLAAESLPITELYAQSKSLLEGIDDLCDYFIKDKLLKFFPEHARSSLAPLLDQPLDKFYEHALNLSSTSSTSTIGALKTDHGPYLCPLHRRYGKKAYRCVNPSKCQGLSNELRTSKPKN